MEWIGKRVKSRSKERLYVANKRKKMEAAANVTPFPQKRRRQRRRQDSDSDIEDITPAYNPDSEIEDITPAYNDLLPAQVRDKPSTGSTIRSGSEQNIAVKESLFRVIRDLNVKKSGSSSSGLRDVSEQNTCVEKSFLKVRDLDVPDSSGLKDVSEQNRDLDVPGSLGLKDVSEQNRDLDVPGSSGLQDVSEQNRDLDVPDSSALKDVSEQNRDLDVPGSLGLKDVSEQNRDLDVPGSSGLQDVSEQNRDLDVPDSSALKDVSEQSRDLDVPGSSGLKDVPEQDTFVKDMYSHKIRGLDAEKSVPSSSGLRDVCELKTSVKDKCSFDIKGLNAENSVPGEIEILSDSESDIEFRASAKKKHFKDGGRIVESSSDGEDDTSEFEEEEVENQDSEENNVKDDITVHSLSSEDPSSSSLSSSSSSSSDDEFNVKEVVGDTDDDDLRTATLPIRKVSIAERKPLGRYKRSGSCLTKPRKEDKKVRKLDRREDEVERVAKHQGSVVFTCTHCGKENTGTPESRSSCVRPQALGDEIEEVNNFASTNTSKLDSVSINSGRTLETSSRPEAENPETRKKVKTPEKPSTFGPKIIRLEKDRELQAPEKSSTSKHEIVNMEKAEKAAAPEKPSRLGIQNLKKAKEVQANNRLGSMIPAVAVAVAEGLDRSVLANEPIDDVSDSYISSADKSGYDSEPALKDKEIKANNNAEGRMINGNHKEVDLFRLLVNSVWDKGQLGEGEEEEDKLESSPEDRSEEQGKKDQRKYDDDGLLIIRPAPLELRFGVEEPQLPPAKTELEREEQSLWEELAFYSRSNDAGSVLFSTIEKGLSTDESPAALCKIGNHELCLDLEIGLKCIHCGFVHTEIRDMDVAEWGEKITSGRRKFDRFEEEDRSSFLGEFGFEVPNQNSSKEGCVCFEGSVWDKIPGVKSQMYPHQQEGFEFIWRNLAGTIKLDELKNFENSDETGGCIMSHAPGTGKTRLTIIFLQTYLECFPDCKPVIIAPASLLLTWAEEFKKWNISIPFHNLSSLEFTGKENSTALELLMRKNSRAKSNNEIRMVKLYSWIKAKSILGISYNLYEKLAGVKGEEKKTKTVRKMKPYKELEAIREILMGMPGLLVLDEAHTPRNQRSCIWKTLSKVETQKRILLSGTPFQNNFQELCNVLGLARPKYLEKLSGMTVTKRGRRTLGDEINNGGIEELKTVMFPFVHVHKGSILQNSLPGLRECVVVLNPPELQKRVLESIEVTYNRKKKNVFETEHKLSLVSVHPSLVSRCKLSGKERLSIDEALLAQLKKVRLDPNQSVKTKFLIEFIRLCKRIEEKVLVFSQYIDPLKLIMKHLVSCFKWTEGEEVLYMHGKLEQKQRQTLINEFNDPRSKAKVFLASTKACSEGINLVGASRVILLDVVWNPAVERQAISRAYRIGQQRIVYTYHLVAKGTPEGPKYCKQAQKDRISELVFACSSKHDKGKDKISEIVTEDKVLDTMVQHSTLGDMFDNLIVQPKEADLVEGFSILMP